MTMTVKLDPAMEQHLRQRSALLGRPAGDIIREALLAWFEKTPAPASTAFSLGSDLFGRYQGTAGLAIHRKELAAGVGADKHTARRG